MAASVSGIAVQHQGAPFAEQVRQRHLDGVAGAQLLALQRKRQQAGMAPAKRRALTCSAPWPPPPRTDWATATGPDQ